MKRSTLILLVIAIGLAVGVYYLEIKNGKPRDEADKSEPTKVAFGFTQDDIAGITINRVGETVTVENRDGKWFVTQPVNTPADESAISVIASGLVDAKVERTFPAEDLKTYGLSEPPVTLEVRLKSGDVHIVRMGSKDFSGLSVYALIDQITDVAMIPASLLTSSDKSFDELRDRSLLNVSQWDVTSVNVTNEHGTFALKKEGGDWKVNDAAADESQVTSLLSQLTTGKVADFVSESGDDTQKFGFDKPKITVKVALQEGERILTVGAEDGEQHYAKASDKSQVFKIDSALYEQLNTKPSSYRDKTILKFDREEITRVQLKNPNLKLVAEKQEEKWLIKEPSDKKDKEFSSFRVFNALGTTANEVLENAPASVKSKLAKPAVEVTLSFKDGKTSTLKLSAADGEDVYVQVDGRPIVYKAAKIMLDQLSFKIDEAVSN